MVIFNSGANLHPTIHRCMVYCKPRSTSPPSCGTQGIAQILMHAQQDDVRLEMTPLKGVLGVHERGGLDERQ
ncbi:MAG: hypothetical protein V7K48_28605 [Nostoc sp.]|uniref:hypothetical protein n=1 Tax=Nostoc sp. TaxID=1180 RepID=UPI002FFC5CED